MQNNTLKFKIKNFFGIVVVFFIFHLLIIINSVYAVCPLCTVAVGGGVGLCRMLGIDDTIAGVWLGGLTVSLGLWIDDFLTKKKINIKAKRILSLAFSALLVGFPLFWKKMIGIAGNTLFGIDKLILGIIFGIIGFVLAIFTDKFLRKINRGKVVIYYQKVIIPLLYLTILSLVFYRLTC